MTLLLVPLGIASKIYSGPAEHWIRGYAGGILYVAFWSLLVLTLRPRWSERGVVLLVLLITSALECLQLWHPAPLEAIRATRLGRALIGDSFSWPDFIAYLTGAWLALACAKALRPAGRDRSGE